MTFNESAPWMTFFACLLAVLFTLVGGIVALVHTESLSFQDYLDHTGKAAVGLAALGAGRQVRKGLTKSTGAEIGGSWLNRAPVMTFTIGAMALIAGTAGGVLTIADPSLLTFDQYLDQMTAFAAAVGLQGAGRALGKGIEAKGTAGPAGAGAGAGPGVGDITQHPDFAGAAGLAPIVPGTGPEPDFVDPEDRASPDDELGAEEDPGPAPAPAPGAGPSLGAGPAGAAAPASSGDAGYADIAPAELDESGLPTDEEEAAHPPPDDDDLTPSDAYALDVEGASGPSAVMPSQEEGSL